MLDKLKLHNNYFFKKKPVFNIILDNNTYKNVSLKSLLKGRIESFYLLKNLKIRITLAENTIFNVIDDLFALNLFNSKIEFILNKNSHLNYKLDTSSLKTCKDFCGNCNSCKNEEDVKKELIYKFLQKGSSADIKLSINGAGSYNFDIKTIQNHLASNTNSNLIIKSALSQGSTLKADNLVKIAQDLVQVSANQLNKNLLLGCSSKVICLPKLEVESDDVSCKHGAAVSKIDENQLFYLKSRGIDNCKARLMLIDSFLN